MPLDFPPHFPEAYRLRVISAEASARAKLFKRLNDVDWSFLPMRGQYISRDNALPLVVEYLCTVAQAFAEQACLAVRAKHYPATLLDAAVEGFVAQTQQHILTTDHEKILDVWTDYSKFTADSAIDVRRASRCTCLELLQGDRPPNDQAQRDRELLLAAAEWKRRQESALAAGVAERRRAHDENSADDATV
jgi:hypothetical protein